MSAYQAIDELLGRYFDALYECDTRKMRAVFHPRAIYATADEHPMLFRDLPTYLDVIEVRESPASRDEERRDYIDAIELAGENTARARVRCSIGSRDFIDFLTLVREEGRWQIIAKVFHIDKQGGPTNAIR